MLRMFPLFLGGLLGPLFFYEANIETIELLNAKSASALRILIQTFSSTAFPKENLMLSGWALLIAERT